MSAALPAVRGVFVASLVLVSLHPLKAGDWSQFLGPNRDGRSNETGLLDAWPEGGPRVVWRALGGTGMSGVAIAGGRAYTLLQKSGKQCLVALDAKTGKLQWETELVAAYKNSQGDGPRATPTVTETQIFCFTGQGILVALDRASGKKQWAHDCVRAYQGKPSDYGMSSSPLVVGSQVVVTAGVKGASIQAYEQKTGKLAWKSGDDRAGYSSAALLKVGGREQIVAITAQAVVGLHPAKGGVLWRFLYETEYDCNTATPIAVGDMVFVSAGENHGSALLKLEPTTT
ncbi:MAG: PQQ-binding-like beta-propeller repeat protein, partial [Planctomycetota bacterium]